MTIRRNQKTPAYAKKLIASRMTGTAPLWVNLVYGNQWDAVPDPKVCVNPREFEVGKFDWRCIAGLLVNVHDQTGVDLYALDELPDDLRRLFGLLGEIAALAAPVNLCIYGLPVADVSAIAVVMKRKALGAHPFTAELIKDYEARVRGWFADAHADVERRLSECCV